MTPALNLCAADVFAGLDLWYDDSVVCLFCLQHN